MNEARILCSTGTLVGKANGYDHRAIINYKNEIDADGFELMMLSAWYGRLPEIAKELAEAHVETPVIHFEKDVAPLLFLGDEESRREGLRLFRENVKMGVMTGAEKAVFHLWDGRFSEEQLRAAFETVDTLYTLCEQEGIDFLVENIPCRVRSPFDMISALAERREKARFTFDTRHASFMGECERFFRSPLFRERVAHLHFSDFTGATLPDKWGVTRPILQPGEGIIDFERLFDEMPAFDGDTATLESPVLNADGTENIEKLNRSLGFLAKKIKKQRFF